MKAGTEFETLAKDIFDLIAKGEPSTNIEGPKVFLDGTDGKREFDLVIRTRAAGLDFLTVVECRDHAKKLDVTHVDGFHSKMMDVNASKGVLISRHGYTSKAEAKAARLGISLYVGYDSKRVSRQLCQDGFGVPLIVHEIGEVELGKISLEICLEAGNSYPKDMANRVNDKSLDEHLRSAFFNGLLKPKCTDEFQIWNPLKLREEIYIRDTCGRKAPVSEFSVQFKVLEIASYWGYFHELPNTRGLMSLPETLHEFTFQSDDLIGGAYKACFQQLPDDCELPRSSLTAVQCEFEVKLSGLNIRGPFST